MPGRLFCFFSGRAIGPRLFVQGGPDMNAYLEEPEKLPLWVRIGLYFARKSTGKDLLLPRVLSWNKKVLMGSTLLEMTAAHAKGKKGRLLKLVRIQCSLAAACPFCVDMNSQEKEEFQITDEELDAMKGKRSFSDVPSLDGGEKAALEYARMISSSPLNISGEAVHSLKKYFSNGEIVLLAGTAAQVNYWARLIQALGVPPAGFCEISSSPEGEPIK